MIFEKDNLPMQVLNVCTNNYYQEKGCWNHTSRLKDKKVMKDLMFMKDLNVYISKRKTPESLAQGI